MKAAVSYSTNSDLAIEEVHVDKPIAREILIKVMGSGLCRSDLHFIEGKYNSPKPEILGHEASGIVEMIGDQVSYVKPGDRVIACISAFCGYCQNCMIGRPVLCNSKAEFIRSPNSTPRLSMDNQIVHQNANLAAYAEYMLIHENSVVKVDDEVPFEVLALIGCGVTTGLGAVLNTAKMEFGSTVAIIGCGGVGLSAVQGARLTGASQIIAIDTVPVKLDMARNLGATHTIDASSENVVEAVNELSEGGVQYSFDAIGTKQSAEQSFEMLSRGGTATIVGMIPQGVKIELDGPSFIRERKIQGSNMGSNRFRVDMPRYIQFYKQGRLMLDELVSQTISLNQINTGFEQMKKGNIARSVIIF